MAKGTRAPLMMVPLSATSMESAMPADTMAAPHAPAATAVASDAGLLAVQPMVEKAEVQRRARIEKRGVRDLVLQRLGYGRIVTIRANLDLVPCRMRGQNGIRVAAPEAALLESDDRRRKRVRPQVPG